MDQNETRPEVAPKGEAVASPTFTERVRRLLLAQGFSEVHKPTIRALPRVGQLTSQGPQPAA